MAGDTHKTGLVSEKLYRRLLWLYPKTHREQYGASMAQAFRDQHRDALRTAPRSGLIRLWLRILPDLLKSSFGEHLAALKERDPMLERLNLRLPSPRFTFLVIFVAVSLVVFGGSAIVTFMLPKKYFSSARIAVRNPPANARTQESKNTAAAYDPFFIQAECETILSEAVLGPVVENLNLNDKWGKNYNNGVPLKTSESMELLKDSFALGPVRNTSIIEIKAWSDNPKTAADIANALAEAFKGHRLNEEKQRPLEAGAVKPITDRVVLITDPAVPDPDAVLPNKARNLVSGLTIGTLLGLGAAGMGAAVSAFVRRKTGKEPPAQTVRQRRLLDKTAGALWTLLSAILCGLLLAAILRGPEMWRTKIEANRDWIFLLPVSLFWGANALLGVLLFLGKSFARISIGIEVLLFVAFLVLTMGLGWPGLAILRCAFLLGGMLFAGVLLWPRRQIRNELVPAN